MKELPTYIQRSHYAPNRAQRRRDAKLVPEQLRHNKRTERMIIRGPGIVGSPNCQVVARFSGCPDELMEALIHRYNQHNYLVNEIERLKAHGWKRIRLAITAAFQMKPRIESEIRGLHDRS